MIGTTYIMYQIFEKPIYQPIIRNHNIGKYTNEKKMENPITKKFPILSTIEARRPDMIPITQLEKNIHESLMAINVGCYFRIIFQEDHVQQEQ